MFTKPSTGNFAFNRFAMEAKRYGNSENQLIFIFYFFSYGFETFIFIIIIYTHIFHWRFDKTFMTFFVSHGSSRRILLSYFISYSRPLHNRCHFEWLDGNCFLFCLKKDTLIFWSVWTK